MEEILKKYPKKGFLGIYDYKIDSKYRLLVPPDFIDLLKTEYQDEHLSLILCLSLELSISAFPHRNYDEYLSYLQQRSLLDRNMRAVITMTRGTSSPQTLDSQNRIKIHEELLSLAGIIPPSEFEEGEGTIDPDASPVPYSKEVYIKGFGDHFEIWAKHRWNKFILKTSRNLDAISDKLSDNPIPPKGG